MSEIARSDTYYVTDTDETIGRLIRYAKLTAPNVRDGFQRTDMGPGTR